MEARRVETRRSHVLDLDRRVRRRAGPGPAEPARGPGPGALRLVLPHAHLPADARERGRRDGPGRRRRGAGFEGIGAWILGRNMFGPVRGPWPDESWKGWWGDEPPYHTPVFVLTHHARPPLVMKGGTEFRFVTDGIQAALEKAREAAGGRDVRIGGGVSTIRQYLEARLVDELHLAISPVLLGTGENLLGRARHACARLRVRRARPGLARCRARDAPQAGVSLGGRTPASAAAPAPCPVETALARRRRCAGCEMMGRHATPELHPCGRRKRSASAPCPPTAASSTSAPRRAGRTSPCRSTRSTCSP